MRLKSASLIALGGVVFSVASYFLLDVWVAELVLARKNPAIHDDTAIAAWKLITEMGNSTWMGIGIVVLGLLAFAMRLIKPGHGFWPLLHRRSIFIFSAVAIPGLFVLVLKAIVGRARPYMVENSQMFFNPFVFDSDFASWPSGHTTTAFAFAAAVGLLLPRTRIILFPLAALTGFSRMALGVHYTGDVVMGAIIGTLGAYLVYHYFSRRWKI